MDFRRAYRTLTPAPETPTSCKHTVCLELWVYGLSGGTRSILGAYGLFWGHTVLVIWSKQTVSPWTDRMSKEGGISALALRRNHAIIRSLWGYGHTVYLGLWAYGLCGGLSIRSVWGHTRIGSPPSSCEHGLSGDLGVGVSKSRLIPDPHTRNPEYMRAYGLVLVWGLEFRSADSTLTGLPRS